MYPNSLSEVCELEVQGHIRGDAERDGRAGTGTTDKAMDYGNECLVSLTVILCAAGR